MNDVEILAAIADLETEFPVDQWTIDGLHVWPLIRYAIATRNHSILMREASGSPCALNQIASRVRGNLRTAWAALKDHEHTPLSIRRADAVFFSDGVSFVRLDGRWVERHCDPIADQIESGGGRVALLTPLHGPPIPRSRPSWFLQPAIDLTTVAAKAAHLARPARPLLAGFKDAMRRLYERWGAVAASESELSRQATYILSYSRLYRGLLKRIRPKAVFVVCYYGGERYAMIHAARHLGLLSVDIQHGVAGDSHWAYTSWQRVPKSGYSVMPSHFWCWRDEDAEAIARWAGQGGPHRPLVGGNPLAEAFLDDGGHLATSYDRARESSRPDAVGKPAVLITLNGFETQTQLEAIAECLRRLPSMFFWVRLHPSRLGRAEGVFQALRTVPRSQWDLSSASSLPLYALLRAVRVHITEGSSTAYEAAMFGVPTVLVSNTHSGLFRPLAAEGWIRETSGNACDVSAAVTAYARAPMRRRSSKSHLQDALAALGFSDD